MKKLILLTVVFISSIFLMWCTPKENLQLKYQTALKECNMPWYEIYHTKDWEWYSKYECLNQRQINEKEFNKCVFSCDKLIDHNRDLSLSNTNRWEIECMKICLWRKLKSESQS